VIIHGYVPKSKKRKVPKAKREQYENWLKSIEDLKPKRINANSKIISKTVPSPKIPPGRETPRYQSLDTGFVPLTKNIPFSYTGDKMKGVATMHKSNAVPVFSDKEAKEISSMRR